MTSALNYKHLYYFWVVAKEGGISRAAEKLDVATQTISAQVQELERNLGCALLKSEGRRLTLTTAGLVAMKQADKIFELGESLAMCVRDAASSPTVRLMVGVCEGLPKLVVHRLLEPVSTIENLRLQCYEGDFDTLVSDLALHRLDVVLSDRPVPPNPNIKLCSHALGSSRFAWYATADLVAKTHKNFPHSLSGAPLLLPSARSFIRSSLDLWLERKAIRPRIVGEFQDSALLKIFGGSGMGIFPMVESVHEDLTTHYAVRKLGICDGVVENFFAIGVEKKVQHPLVQRLLDLFRNNYSERAKDEAHSAEQPEPTGWVCIAGAE